MEYPNGNVFQLSVEQKEPTLIPPAEETEKGIYFLSNLDQNIAVIVRTIYCFKSAKKGNGKAVETIKNSEGSCPILPACGAASYKFRG
ncbi:Omega-hydroxypalmitate O-feruloyl transferase [Quillaja saponaria]|uniref:Omega-hydroxypalmitate O-feruloyl transferase n=1 Tax=Quillaja saponaria TaxID=32244 RepID=A0AAD7PYW8_QUISA|nr:Omega-hydroxypalmitate O-feruloyl transferase [Quillaja saponaria]